MTKKKKRNATTWTDVRRWLDQRVEELENGAQPADEEDRIRALAAINAERDWLEHTIRRLDGVTPSATEALRPKGSPMKSLVSGLLGAGLLTLSHETLRSKYKHAPRVDLVGTRGLARIIRGVGKKPPKDKQLHRWAMAGDLVSNAAYYSFAARYGLRGALLFGMSGGLGAALLPGVLGLGSRATTRTAATTMLTVGLYTWGAVAGWGVRRILGGRGS